MEIPTNLFIPGAGKSGTSSLHYYLSQHAQINMSSIKEPHYFSRNDNTLNREAYMDLFDFENSVKYYGESSTSYFISPDAPRLIKASCHAPKFIFILRDPIERIESHYNWLFSLNAESRTFSEAISEKLPPFDFSRVIGNTGFTYYMEFSMYFTNIKRYIDIFGQNNIMLISTEELAKYPVKTVNYCFDFLGVDKISSLDFEPKNQTKKAVFYNEPKSIRVIKKLVPKFVKKSLINSTNIDKLVISKNLVPKEPVRANEAEKRIIYDVLKEDMLKLNELNIVDTSHWKTWNKLC